MVIAVVHILLNSYLLYYLCMVIDVIGAVVVNDVVNVVEYSLLILVSLVAVVLWYNFVLFVVLLLLVVVVILLLVDCSFRS